MTAITPLAIPEVLLITPKRHGDARGWFAETWSEKLIGAAGDLRAGSPSDGRWVAATLTASGGGQLFVPRGFAHGYCTLEDDTELFYKVDGQYAPELEGGVAWNDPDLAIAWPFNGEPVLSDKDRALPRLKDLGAVQF